MYFSQTLSVTESRNEEAWLVEQIMKLSATNPTRKTTILKWENRVIDKRDEKVHELVSTMVNETTFEASNLSVFQTDILTELGLNDRMESLDSSSDISKTMERLVTEGEDDIQDLLNAAWMKDGVSFPDSFAIDTHKSNWHLPLFKFPNLSGHGNPRSAKPDYVSSIAPMFLELKSLKGKTEVQINEQMCQVINQAIQRVHICALQNETLHTVFAFATVGSKSWIVIFKRNFEKLFAGNGTRRLEDTYHLFPLETKLIFPLWHSFNRLVIEDQCKAFIHPHGFVLAQLLCRLGYHPGFCGIHFQTTRSNVFVITPGVKDKPKDSVTNIFIAKSGPSVSFVIKLTMKSESRKYGQTESEVLALKQLRGSSCVGYMLAVADSPSMATTVFNENANLLIKNHLHLEEPFGLAILPTETTTERFKHHLLTANLGENLSPPCKLRSFWWDYRHPLVDKEYIAIVMRKAYDYVKVNSSATQLFACLTMMHKLGVLHCDLRRQNLMHFVFEREEIKAIEGDKPLTEETAEEKKVPAKTVDRYYIIDFDLSTCLKADQENIELDLTNSAGQKQQMIDMGGILKNPLDSHVIWNGIKDVRMLQHSLGGLSSTLPFVAPPEDGISMDMSCSVNLAWN
jgi:hypothetical protein